MHRSLSSHRRAAAALFVLAGAALAVGGCTHTNSRDDRWGDIKKNVTPELQGSARTYDEVANNVVVNTNTGRRQMFDDLGRLVHANRPSRLTTYPVPH